MSRIRGGTMGAWSVNGMVPARSQRATKQKLFVEKNQKPCPKCGNTKMLRTNPDYGDKKIKTIGQVKCTKCKYIIQHSKKL